MIRIKICALLAAVAMEWSVEAASVGNSLGTMRMGNIIVNITKNPM